MTHLSKKDLASLERLPTDPSRALIVGRGDRTICKLEIKGLVRWRGEVLGGHAYSITEDGLAALKARGES